MKKIFEYIAPYKRPMLLGLFLKFVAAMLDLMIPFFLERIIDEIAPTNSIPRIIECGALMLFCSIASVVVNVTANRMATDNSGKITQTLRHDLFKKITYLSSAKTDSFTIPSLISRLTADTYNVNTMLVRTQRLGVRSPFLLLGGVAITLTLDPVMTLILLCMLPIIALVVWLVTKYSVPIYTRCQQVLDKLVRIIQENATGVRVIRALSKSEHERKRMLETNAQLTAQERLASAVMAITNPTATLVLYLGLTIVVAAGAFRVNSGLTAPGVIIAFLSYFTIILNAMLGITRIFVVCSKGSASARRIAQVLETEDALPIPPQGEKVCEQYHVQMDDVSFSYNKVEDNVCGISFKLKRGETLGIIGATGSGKSTLINLLIRFYDPDRGTIRIDGRDIRSMTPQQLRSKFGIAFQNDFIYAASIRENIDFGRNLSDEQIAKAIKIAQAQNIIDEAPDGLEHMLTSRGTNISGGQRQRIIVARSIAAEPEILVLDDASSALDYKTDAMLRRAIHEALPDITTIIIAQRISSIMNADHILVLDDGRVIGSGVHEQLIRDCAEYRLIAKTQMGGIQ